MISDRDFEQLSAYLDHQLSASEQSVFEARLLKEPELKAALRDLRFQQKALRDLPRHKVPRNFTLSAKQAEAIRPARRSWLNSLFPASPVASPGRAQSTAVAALFPALRMATALSGLAFVFVLAMNFLQQPAALQTAAVPAAESVQQETEKALAQDSVGGAAPSATEDVGAFRITVEGTGTPEAMTGVAGVSPFSETQASEYATTPQVASPNLAPPDEQTPSAALESAPAVSNAEPAAEAQPQAMPVSGLQLAAIGLGLLTALLTILTWLVRR